MFFIYDKNTKSKCPLFLPTKVQKSDYLEAVNLNKLFAYFIQQQKENQNQQKINIYLTIYLSLKIRNVTIDAKFLHLLKLTFYKKSMREKFILVTFYATKYRSFSLINRQNSFNSHFYFLCADQPQNCKEYHRMCSYPKPENIYFNSEMNPNLNIIIHYALTVKYLPQFRIILIETTQLPRSYFIVFYNNKVQMAHFPQISQSQNILYFNECQNMYGNEVNQVCRKVLHKQTSQFDNQENKLKSRSKKKISHFKNEISFEKDIIDSHIKGFEKLFFTYKTQISKISNIKNQQQFLNQQYQSSQRKEQQNIQICQWLKAHTPRFPYLTDQLLNQLILDWRCQENLSKFLQAICRKLNKYIIEEVIYLAYFTWEKYLSCFKFDFYDYQLNFEQMRLTPAQLQSFYQSQYLRNLTFNSVNNEEVLNYFNQFVDGFVKTIFLVIQGYFDNPYAPESQQQTRSRSNFFGQINQSFNDVQISYEGLPRKINNVKYFQQYE